MLIFLWKKQRILIDWYQKQDRKKNQRTHVYNHSWKMKPSLQSLLSILYSLKISLGLKQIPNFETRLTMTERISFLVWDDFTCTAPPVTAWTKILNSSPSQILNARSFLSRLKLRFLFLSSWILSEYRMNSKIKISDCFYYDWWINEHNFPRL